MIVHKRSLVDGVAFYCWPVRDLPLHGLHLGSVDEMRLPRRVQEGEWMSLLLMCAMLPRYDDGSVVAGLL